MIQIYDPATTTLVNGTYHEDAISEQPDSAVAIRSRVESDRCVRAAAAQAEHSGSCPRHLGVRPQQCRFLRDFQFPNNKYSIKADQVITSKQRIAFLFSRTRQQDLGAGSALPRCLFRCRAIRATTARTFIASATTTPSRRPG